MSELGQLAPVETRQGWETKELRETLGLRKSSNKLAETFSAHAVDAWVLAWSVVGGPPLQTRPACCVSCRSDGIGGNCTGCSPSGEATVNRMGGRGASGSREGRWSSIPPMEWRMSGGPWASG